MIVMEKIVWIMIIDDEIKIRRDILDKKKSELQLHHGLAKLSQQPGSNDRLTKLENQIYQELKKLTATPRISTALPRTQQNVSNSTVKRPETQALANLFGRS